MRYFLPNRGIVDKIIDFVSLPGETSDLQCDMLKEVIQKFNLRDKTVALCADNTNTNLVAIEDLANTMYGGNLKLNWREKLLVSVADTHNTQLLAVCC